MRAKAEKKTERDPNIDNKAVALYRSMAKWNTNWIQRKEIALTVDANNPRAMNLWEDIIYDHLLKGRWAGDVKTLLNEFDRLSPRVLGNGRNGR